MTFNIIIAIILCTVLFVLIRTLEILFVSIRTSDVINQNKTIFIIITIILFVLIGTSDVINQNKTFFIIITIILFVLIGTSVALIRSKSIIRINILRGVVIFTSLACILIYLLVKEKPFPNNFFIDTLWMYTFFKSPFLYLIPIILVIYDIYFLIKDRNIKYLYPLIFIDILFPILGIYYYNEFFTKVF